MPHPPLDPADTAGIDEPSDAVTADEPAELDDDLDGPDGDLEPTEPVESARSPRPAKPAELSSLGRLVGSGGLGDERLSDDESAYVRSSRAANTLRGYRADWAEFTTWCTHHGHTALPADPAGVSAYLADLARAGAAVGTMNRRRSAIRYAHTMAGHPDPLNHPRVLAVWDGIRRTHTRPPAQATPLMPPFLFQVVDACPTTKTWKDPRRPPEPDLAGARDRALLLLGFVTALRRSELAALTLADVRTHPDGLVLTLPRSKTNQHGDQHELVIVPRARDHTYCPVTALHHWLDLAGIGPLPHPDHPTGHPASRSYSPGPVGATGPSPAGPPAGFPTPHDIQTPQNIPTETTTGGRAGSGEHLSPTSDPTTPAAEDTAARHGRVPVFQSITKANRPTGRPLRPETINTLVQHAVTRTGRPADGYSAHSLRAGFVTYAHLRGATDRAIAHQTRHRSMASLGQYIRIHTAWTDNAATHLL